MFQSDSSFAKLRKLMPSTPTPNFMSFNWVLFRRDINKIRCRFQKIKVLKYYGYKCLHFLNFAVFLPGMHTKYTCILKMVTFVLEKMKLPSFSLILDVPPRPKMPFGQLNVAI